MTGTDWRNMFLGQPAPINRDAAHMVYDIAWFIVKDVTAAAEVTTITFRVALARLEELPVPIAYTAWLAGIATNEAHRYLEEAPTRRPTSVLAASGAEREALYLADTLGELRADHKLALLLRYRYNTPPNVMTMALDMRPRRLARLFVAAREEFAKHSTLPPAALATADPPPPRHLPQLVEPYSAREMRPWVLGYPWRDSAFAGLPEREDRRARWATLVVTVLLLVAIALLITRPWSAERPELVDPGTASEILLLDG
ncbi:MAG: hypothetical protein ACR2P0_05915 [Acidimicrobiales bacterium]